MPTSQPIRFGVFEVSLRTGELRKHGIKIHLQEQPFTVLAMLLEHPGEIVTREEVRHRLWGEEFIDVEHGLARAVNKLREALGDSAENPRFIETLPRRGFRFIAPVHVSSNPNADKYDSAVSARSLAVLPFLNAASVEELDYVCDGITESLIYSSAQLSGLRVMASSTVFRFKGATIDAQLIGKELRVDAIVTGKVRRRGEYLVINVELVDVEDGGLLWGEQYTRKFADIFAVQEEIASEIFSKLRIRLSREEATRISRRQTTSPEAYDLYMQGRFLFNRRNVEDLKKSLDCYQRAIAIDPKYALAYAGIADYFALLNVFPYSLLPARDAIPRAREAAAKALEIDPGLAEAHTSLGQISFYYDWDYATAQKQFKRAMSLKPSYPPSYQWHCLCLATLGRYEEAAVEAYRALELDPRSPAFVRCLTAVPFYFGRKFEKAGEMLREVVRVDPQLFMCHLFLGYCLCALGRLSEAADAFEMARRVTGDSDTSLSRLGFCHGLAGRLDEARAILARLEEERKRRYVALHHFVFLHLGLGEVDRTFEYLQQSLQEKSDYLVYLAVEPLFDPIRNDSRFTELLKRLNLLGDAATAGAR